MSDNFSQAEKHGWPSPPRIRPPSLPRPQILPGRQVLRNGVIGDWVFGVLATIRDEPYQKLALAVKTRRALDR